MRRHSEKETALAIVTVMCGSVIIVLGTVVFLLVWALTWHLWWALTAMGGFNTLVTLYWLVMCVGIAWEKTE